MKAVIRQDNGVIDPAHEVMSQLSEAGRLKLFEMSGRSEQGQVEGRVWLVADDTPTGVPLTPTDADMTKKADALPDTNSAPIAAHTEVLTGSNAGPVHNPLETLGTATAVPATTGWKMGDPMADPEYRKQRETEMGGQPVPEPTVGSGTQDGKAAESGVLAFEPLFPEVGDTVLYVLNEGNGVGQARPAIVVRTWHAPSSPSRAVNLQVFTDGCGNASMNDGLPNVIWRSSACYDDQKSMGTWHWPPARQLRT